MTLTDLPWLKILASIIGVLIAIVEIWEYKKKKKNKRWQKIKKPLIISLSMLLLVTSLWIGIADERDTFQEKKNQIENQEVLVQLNYSFDFTRKNSDDSSEVIPIMNKMINQLSQNNYYQLKIISNGKKSLFMTDINSFYVFDEEIHDADFIKDAFAPIILRNEYSLLSRQFTIKILMKATNLNFLLNNVKAGDGIEFVLLKNLDEARKNETPLRFPFHTFSGSFAPFHYPKSENEVITGDIDLSIKLRNGKVLNSKTITCEIAGTYANNGFRYFAEIE